MRVMLKRDYFGPDGTLYFAKYNPNILPDDWEDILPAESKILNDAGEVRERRERKEGAVEDQTKKLVPQQAPSTALFPAQTEAERAKERELQASNPSAFNARGESLTGTTGNKTGTNQPIPEVTLATATAATAGQGEVETDEEREEREEEEARKKAAVSKPNTPSTPTKK